MGRAVTQISRVHKHPKHKGQKNQDKEELKQINILIEFGPLCLHFIRHDNWARV